MQCETTGPEAILEWVTEGTRTKLLLRGRLDAWSTGEVWTGALQALEQRKPGTLILDGGRLAYCDGSGMALIVALCEKQKQRGGAWQVENLKPETQALFSLCNPQNKHPVVQAPDRKASLPEEIGKAAVHIWRDAAQLIAFVGELAVWMGCIMRRPRLLRIRDVLSVMETAGLNALPIIGLIGLLLGLILAFQSAIPLAQFGAELFVANLVSISLLRELGPLITAIILTARSGSAFAAEIGTMTINEEVDALTTMGLDPVRFLVVPRVIGAVLITPMLAVFASLFGLIGAGLVMVALGFPLVTYFNQILSSVHLKDLLSGLFKAFIFGILISAVGCQRGLQTGTGASAVGESTTRSVVSAVVLIVVVDGLFAVVFYYLGI
ncbi:MAG: MlaE family lipid ABC transporter permease subunit [Lentisphaerota bacterium]